ncbi:DNA repair protein RadC [Myxococcota bacterium]|nr:DNA repair protein RadC [Myxococcota bacterium]
MPTSDPVSAGTVSDRPLIDPPRERLEHLGPRALGDAELLGLLLRTGGPGVSAREVGAAMLSRVGGLRGLACASGRELAACRGVGPVKAASVLASLELGRRLAAHRLQAGTPLRTAEEVYRHFYPSLRDLRREQFLAVLVDGRHRVIRTELISQGTLNASLVHPREVFRCALREAAAALVVVHNHPSGDPAPSHEDRDITRRLVDAGELLGVRVLDHVVVAERGYLSFAEQGLLEEDARALPGAAAVRGRRRGHGKGSREVGTPLRPGLRTVDEVGRPRNRSR